MTTPIPRPGARVSMSIAIEDPRFSQAWRDGANTYAIVDMTPHGLPLSLTFLTADAARAMAAACQEAAAAIDALPPADGAS